MHQNEMYTIKSGRFASYLGYIQAFDETAELAKRLHKPELEPKSEDYGKDSLLEKRAALLKFAQSTNANMGTWFNAQTPKEVRKILEAARRNGDTLRIFYGHRESGLDWMEQHDVLGRIGRSTGILKVPLLLTHESSTGGPSILDSSIVRIINVSDEEEVYRHPLYHQPKIEIVQKPQEERVTVKVGGDVHSVYPDIGTAANWVAFITGADGCYKFH